MELIHLKKEILEFPSRAWTQAAKAVPKPGTDPSWAWAQAKGLAVVNVFRLWRLHIFH